MPLSSLSDPWTSRALEAFQEAAAEGAPATFVERLPLPPLDLVGIGLVAILVILGLWRGLWWQVIRLAGILAAVLLARALTPGFGDWIAEHWPELPGRLRYGTAWFLIFLLAMGAATLLGVLGQKMLEAMQLGFANRIGGGFIGAATGVLLHLALVLVILQLAPERFVQRVVAGTYSQEMFDLVEEHVGEMIDDPTVKARVRDLLRTEDSAEKTREEGHEPSHGDDPPQGGDARASQAPVVDDGPDSR